MKRIARTIRDLKLHRARLKYRIRQTTEKLSACTIWPAGANRAEAELLGLKAQLAAANAILYQNSHIETWGKRIIVWTCEQCTKAGHFYFFNPYDLGTLFYHTKDIHAANSPDCQGDIYRVRVAQINNMMEAETLYAGGVPPETPAGAEEAAPSFGGRAGEATRPMPGEDRPTPRHSTRAVEPQPNQGAK